MYGPFRHPNLGGCDAHNFLGLLRDNNFYSLLVQCRVVLEHEFRSRFQSEILLVIWQQIIGLMLGSYSVSAEAVEAFHQQRPLTAIAAVTVESANRKERFLCMAGLLFSREATLQAGSRG
jgi:hypothetical protein